MNIENKETNKVGGINLSTAADQIKMVAQTKGLLLSTATYSVPALEGGVFKSMDLDVKAGANKVVRSLSSCSSHF